jgi:2-polyprenyl-3-methyl-5-hydroxy-6-metoxy-1,4-benzoquinol methylase
MNVRDQYEMYPYPVRNPEDEKVRIENCWHDFLEVINFYCFKGKQNFSGPFRVLVAGGGTGDQTIFLAEQLRYNRRAEIVHLDFSAHSIAIAKRRAQVRKLTNITWLEKSLLDLPSLGVGQFDYINCVGVLHHLEDPPAGLRALDSVLKDDGAMMIMLYGKYGRTGVYQTQELVRRINRNEQSAQQKIENAKAVLSSLPKTNWFKRGEDLIGDHKEYGDAGIYDVFLHAQDRPFTIPEIYELVHGCGLQVIELIERGRAEYMVETYIRDPKLLDMIGKLPKTEQQAIAELISGARIVHNSYVARSTDRVATVEDLRNVPFFFLQGPQDIVGLINESSGRPVSIRSTLYQTTIEFMPGPYTRHIFQHLDGQLSLKEIFDVVRKDVRRSEQELPNEELLKELRPIYERFNNIGWMLLRHRSVGTFRSLHELQRPPV